jgi:flagellar biosynthetic protein FliR
MSMNIPVEILEALLQNELALSVWPFFRIAGVVMVAPVFGARLVPPRVRLAMSVAATYALAPLVPAVPPFSLSLASGFTVAQELLIGIAMGFCLQMIFDALIIAGQTIAMSMGLGMATMIDPQRGISVPVVSQFFVIMGMLVFLALGGHLATVRLIADSFEILPIGRPLGDNGLWAVATYGTEMFAGALRIALPAATALLVANIAFGVMSRAAPSLNLFAVGLPAGLLVGFLLLLLNIGHLSALLDEFLGSTWAYLAAALAA